MIADSSLQFLSEYTHSASYTAITPCILGKGRDKLKRISLLLKNKLFSTVSLNFLTV